MVAGSDGGNALELTVPVEYPAPKPTLDQRALGFDQRL
jgi:hypothetical protein